MARMAVEGRMANSQPISITPLLQKLLDPSHGSATPTEIAAGLALIFENRLSTAQCASLLTLLQSTGRAADPEVVAKCATQMRNACAQVDRQALRAVIRKRSRKAGSYAGGLCDLVGTGGDGHSTFNVSTTASIIASSLLLVCKHGAKSASSKSGAADMLQAIEPEAPIIEAVTAKNLPRAFENGNYAFMFSPIFHPGMRHVAPIRKDLGFRTIFNILGPLANPADHVIEARVCGVAHKGLGRMYVEALKMNGAKKSLVVCGAENLDEISCAGKTFCWRLKERENPEFRGPMSQEDEDYTTSDDDAPPRTLVEIEEFQLEPEDFGLPAHPLSEVLPGQMSSENARILMKLLKNELPPDDPVLHFVLINTAALLVVSGLCDANTSQMGEGDSGAVITETGPSGGRWKEGVRRARWAVESGAAMKSLEEYIDFTKSS
ncbi:MAG: hypothetical protein LQ340_003709 [Diploschistes diacapsis]|nr:MAG: hypothetical protein LQ340_003709 [Diploschistes diacapsis]